MSKAGDHGRPWLAHYPPGARPHLDYPDVPLYQPFYDRARRHPERTAIIYFGTKISYGRLAELCDRFAGWLRELGIQPGDRIGVHLPNIPQVVIAIVGAMRAGAIPSLMNPLYVTREIEHQARDSGIKLLITLDLLAGRAGPALTAAGVPRMVLCRIQDYLPFPLKQLYPLKARKSGMKAVIPDAPAHLWWSDGMARSYPAVTPPAVNPKEDVAVLFYTGGTTGVSKGVMATHHNLLSNAIQSREFIREGMGDDGGDVVIGILPIFHSFGFLNSVSFGLTWGNTSILLPRLDVPQLLQAIRKYKPNAFPGVPTIYTALLNHPDLQKYNLSSIQYCISGAAPLPVELMTRFEQATGGLILEGYGLTETSPVTHATPRFGTRKPGSVGMPVPDVDCRIVHLETAEDLPPGQEGEVLLRGPNVTLGYWNRPEETAQAFRDGWLYTGDIGRMDEDGYLYIVDRKKDMIIAGGFNVYPREIDEVLFQHPKVQEACSVGVPDAYRGETVKAFVVLKAGESATEQEMIAFCRQHLAGYKSPTQVEFIPELPRSAVGKVLRRELARLEREKATAAASSPPV